MIRTRIFLLAAAVVLAAAGAPASAQFRPLGQVDTLAPVNPAPLTPINPATAPTVPLGSAVGTPTPGGNDQRVGTLACPLPTDGGSSTSVTCNFNPAVPGPPVQYSLSIDTAASQPNPGVLTWSVYLASADASPPINGTYQASPRGLSGDNGVTLVPVSLPGVTAPNQAPLITGMRLGS